MSDAEQVYRARPTDEEIDDVLSQRLVATIGTLNPTGSVHLAYVIFDYHDGRVYFETSSVTRKARNAERTGQASVLVQGRAATGRSLMVALEGQARVIGGTEAHEHNRRLRAKYIKPDALPAVDSVWGRLDDVAVEITPTRRRSWTGAVLHEQTQKELSVPYGEIWLGDE
jgi:nitroimidazol reductase NimA-like FMN-containing flavoprotein (pyridoxamine 5'-phosphate oxidase superfamily)